MIALEIRHVEKSFGPARVLRGIDCTVEHGEIVSLLGRSGCGKTTLLRLIAGFDRPDAGRISLAGRTAADALRFVPAEKRNIGYVPQEGALFPHLNVYDNIAFGLHKGPGRAAAVESMLELTDISDLRSLWPHQLSGGQQQRVALARALAPAPRLVLLDEPFNALDANLRSSICLDVMTLLRRVDATALLVTHDQNEAFVCSDRVAIMRGGRIVQMAPPVQLYRQPVDLETAAMVGDVVLLEGCIGADGIQTELGLIPCANHLNRPAGPGVGSEAATGRPGPHRPVRTMLRPEQLKLDAPDQAVRASIVQIGFHGQFSSLRAVLEPQPGKARPMNGAPAAVPAAGAEPTEIMLRSHDPYAYRVGDLVGIRVSGAGMLYAAV